MTVLTDYTKCITWQYWLHKMYGITWQYWLNKMYHMTVLIIQNVSHDSTDYTKCIIWQYWLHKMYHMTVLITQNVSHDSTDYTKCITWPYWLHKMYHMTVLITQNISWCYFHIFLGTVKFVGVIDDNAIAPRLYVGFGWKALKVLFFLYFHVQEKKPANNSFV